MTSQAPANAIETIATLVAASPAFRAEVDRQHGAPADPSDYLSHCHWPLLTIDPTIESERDAAVAAAAVRYPIAVVRTGMFDLNKLGVADGGCFVPSGSAELQLLNLDETPDNLQASEIAFMNFWGGVLNDLATNVDGSLPIQSIEQLVPNQHSELNTKPVHGHFWVTAFRVDWGHNDQ